MTSMVQQKQSVLMTTPHPEEIVTTYGAIRKGMEVWGRDGKVGRVVLIVRDRRTQEPSHLVVRRGWLWGRCLLIPLHWTIDIGDQRINVNLRRNQLEHLQEYRSDEEIARAVHQGIYTSPSFIPRGDCVAVRPLVHDGIVTLRGNVRNGSRRFEAQAIANRVLGVQEVRNELTADDDLLRRVEEALAHDVELRALELSPTVTLGLVHLRGRVPTAALYERIIFLVRQVNGVRAIWDELEVGTAPEQPAYGYSYIPVRQDVQRSATIAHTVGA